MIPQSQINYIYSLFVSFSRTLLYFHRFDRDFKLVNAVHRNLLKKCFSLFLAGLTFLILDFQAWAFEVVTHQQLTVKTIELIESQLDSYLKDNLGLEGGLNASINGGTPRELMIEGNRFEDEDGYTRPINHFHDPISNGGLTLLTALSSVDWSLSPIGDQSPGGPWSWNDAREYYFKALTSPTKGERDENWGKTFRALGQIMHLIQDMASPAHVRNDPHISYSGVGNVDGLHDFMEKRNVDSYVGSGTFSPDSSMLEQPGSTRPEPFSNLFDRNSYSGLNPESTSGANIGIAEYANANFFSDDTIPFQPLINFPSYNYPSLAELVPATTPFLTSDQYLSLLRLGSPADPKARVAKYTGTHALAKFTLANLQYDLIGQLRLDDAVYDAYSSHLIPRAVGYSAAVLDYFFRGKAEIHSSKFEVTGQIQPGTVCAPIPTELPGFLDVKIKIPSDLGFDGMATLYYDRPDKTRVIGDQIINPPSGEELFLGLSIDHAELADPVRWYIVLEGQAGPGAREPRTVFANTDLAAWQFVCLF